jgi:hypothetical protein
MLGVDLEGGPQRVDGELLMPKPPSSFRSQHKVLGPSDGIYAAATVCQSKRGVGVSRLQ